MSYKIVALNRFQKDVKKLKKRFPKIKNDLILLMNELQTNHRAGISLGENIFKIRVANSSIPTGKSSGFRVITYYKIDETIFLITIYSKSDTANIYIDELQKIIKEELE
jgi:mRNA-degrading endonuclease RelE of RelBE toxin-antitoxin system